MRLDWAILSDFAEVSPLGLFYAIGGGWDTGNRSEYPAPFAGALSVRILFERHEVGRPHTIEVHFADQDGRAVVPPMIATTAGGAVPVGWPTGWDVPLMFVINMHSIMVPRPGTYAIDLLVDGQHQRNIPIRFLLQAALPPGVQPTTPGTPGAG